MHSLLAFSKMQQTFRGPNLRVKGQILCSLITAESLAHKTQAFFFFKYTTFEKYSFLVRCRKVSIHFLEVRNNSYLTFIDNKMYQSKASTSMTEIGSMKLKPEIFFFVLTRYLETFHHSKLIKPKF